MLSLSKGLKTKTKSMWWLILKCLSKNERQPQKLSEAIDCFAPSSTFTSCKIIAFRNNFVSFNCSSSPKLSQIPHLHLWSIISVFSVPFILDNFRNFQAFLKDLLTCMNSSDNGSSALLRVCQREASLGVKTQRKILWDKY